jgi:hypothetical protein
MSGRLRRFEIVLESPLPAPAAWARILDLRAHDRLVPFTHITQGAVAASELRPGHRFVACTMIGRIGFRGRRLGFNDVMTFDELAPPTATAPGHASIAKSGRLILGSVAVTVSPHDGGSEVRWAQTFGLSRFPAPLNAIAIWGARAGYRAVLRRLLRHAVP